MSLFACVPVAVLADERLTGRHLRLLIALYGHANEQGECWCKRETLEAETGYPATRISQLTTELSSFGWLTKEGDGGRAKASLYRMNMDHKNGYQNGNCNQQNGYQNGKQTVTKTVTPYIEQTIEQTITPTITPKPPQYHDETKASEDMPTEGATTGTPELDQTCKTNSTIPTDWQPSDRCLALLARAGITASEALEWVDEFVMYWTGCGEKRKNWDSTFLNHAKRQKEYHASKAQKNRQAVSVPDGSASVKPPPKREGNYGKSKARSPIRRIQSSSNLAERYAVETCSTDA